MISFIDNCIEKVKEKKSHLMVGLDPHYDKFPKQLMDKLTSLKAIGDTIFEFNKNIIDEIYSIVPAVKPQIAFYERFGIEGLKAYKKTVKYAKNKGLIVIGDVKRNDIGSTAKAYSDAHLGSIDVLGNIYSEFNVDAITINPYFGSDGVEPFINDAKKFGKGIFVLVKTSNKSSDEFQNLILNQDKSEKRLFEHIAQYVNKWGQEVIGNSGYSSIGAVVGATFPQEIINLRKIMPKSYFLVPGVGEQGGKIEDLVNCFNEDGLGALISVSRSVIFAYKNSNTFKDKDYALAAKEEVIKLNSVINSYMPFK
jgi:orotidine-5'-phosphate decarboxylase